jgi:phosphoadenosine phosphosulfate reductase
MKFNFPPLHVCEQARQRGIDSVIVGVSGGMDSVVTLDLCKQYFKTLRCYFMYVVPGIGFQERYLQFLERRYEVEIERIPHFLLSDILRGAALRHTTEATSNLRKAKSTDVDAYLRKKFGIHWIAVGEKASDSLERNTQIVQHGGILEKRGRILPLAYWTHAQVQGFMSRNRIPFPPDYNLNNLVKDPNLKRRRGASFGSLIGMREIGLIAEKYPEDYEKIRKFFPFVDVQLVRQKILAESLPNESAE